MIINRRRFIKSTGAILASELVTSRASALVGLHPAKPEDVQLANNIIGRLPSGNYVAIMRALADLDKKEPWSSPHPPKSKREPFNRRWDYYANPLLVRIWHEMGYPYMNDCEPFCGVTLGWTLKRSGIVPPGNCASSQSYLNWGVPVGVPKPGDIAVYTHARDRSKGHVGIYMATNPDGTYQVLGANQLMSEITTCGPGFTANIIDERPMPSSKRPELHFNAFVRAKT